MGLFGEPLKKSIYVHAILAITVIFAVQLFSFLYAQEPQYGGLNYPSDIKRVKERGKLVVAQYQGSRALFFMPLPKTGELPEAAVLKSPDGTMTGGIDIAIAKFVAKRLDVELELKRDYKTFNDVVTAVANGEADLGISKLELTFSRAQSCSFSKPYANFSTAIVASRSFMASKGLSKETQLSEEKLKEVFDNDGITIGVIDGNSKQELRAMLLPKTKEKLFKNYDDALAAVRDGKVAATIIDDFDYMFISSINQELKTYCVMLKLQDRRAKIAAAVRPDSTNLLRLVNEVVDYIGQEDAESMMRKYGRTLKRIEQDIVASGAKVIPGSDYAFLARAKERNSGFALSDAIASVGTAIPMILFGMLWFSLSKRKVRK